MTSASISLQIKSPVGLSRLSLTTGSRYSARHAEPRKPPLWIGGDVCEIYSPPVKVAGILFWQTQYLHKNGQVGTET